MPPSIPVLIGTLNRKLPLFPEASCAGPGLVSGWLDPSTGAFTVADAMDEIDNPAFLALDPAHRTIYCTSEMHDAYEGTASAVGVERDHLRLTYINGQKTLGNCPSHCSTDRAGGLLLVTNYHLDGVGDPAGASVATFRLGADGALQPAKVLTRLEGSGPVNGRQDKSHAHCILATPDNRYAIIADLGADTIVSIPFDQQTGEASGPATSCLLPAGSGPRHFVIRPDGGMVYVLNELASTLTWLSLKDGHLALQGTISSRHPDAGGLNESSDLKLSTDGRFLYAANRGDDTVGIFSVASDGGLTFAGSEPVRGHWPRNLALSPDGKLLLVSNQYSDSIAVFAVDVRDGSLSHINDINISTPMCAVFL